MYKIKPVRPITPRKEKCPFCDKDYKPRDPFRESRCVLNQPLMMVIPPGGVHLSCPIHPEGHHVFGPEISWMDSPINYERNLPDPADSPRSEYDPKRWEDSCQGTGYTGNDLNKFSM